MPLSPERLREIVVELASRPRHEKVRALIYELLVNGLGASSTEVDFERRVPEVHGRIDALLGRTVFEFKSNLEREQGDAEKELTRYLTQRESETGEHYVGIATDGATFVPYELRGGKLGKLDAFQTPAGGPRDRRTPEELLKWLGAAVAVSAELEPTPEVVGRELGRGSLAWHMARVSLAGLWERLRERPDVRLKRDLWERLLERVYGGPVGADALFFQHTYLTTIAKTMATRVLGVDLPPPDALLAGRPFQEAGISGAVESDFFDWPLAMPEGVDLIRRTALQASRFRLPDVKTDVLKGLYESLIDPEQRHDLGEYYTPDWLAERMCEATIDRPLEQRVLDPACGSGTFLFHAVRGLLSAAEKARLPGKEAVALACEKVYGVDIHPVAVQIARVTFLLALGEDRLRDRPSQINVPIYLGDSLQLNTAGMLAEREVLIEVPGTSQLLEFPFAVAGDPAVFDAVIARMLQLSRENASQSALAEWLQRERGITGEPAALVTKTYELLNGLQQAGKDHIWGFVTRNLVRPVWLSQPHMRADVLIGNPPWLSYRFMSKETQEKFKDECQRRGLWAGGKVATHQDLSGYFFVRCVELYLKQGGLIAFVMPYAAMSRRQFAGFRSGVYGRQNGKNGAVAYATVQFTDAWAMSDAVQPLFPVPSCVLFARQGQPTRGPVLPRRVQTVSGTLPRRDASPVEAARALEWRRGQWPSVSDDDAPASPYREMFRQGATMVPRVLCVVERAATGFLGPNPASPVVQSRRTAQEKEPWKSLPTRRGNVEAKFLRPLYLGESVAPFRLLEPVLAVIPWDGREKRLLDASAAQSAGYMYLARWMAESEKLWKEHGRSALPFAGQLDYYGKLTAQFPIAPLRLVYATSGSLQAAAVVTDQKAVIDTKLYWAAMGGEQQGRYLCAVFNSETARSGIEHMQSRGQWGARDFHKVMLSLPIPRFDASKPLHRRIAEAGERAEQVAAHVPLAGSDGGAMHFVSARRAIREALRGDGVAAEIEALVSELLKVAPLKSRRSGAVADPGPGSDD